MQKITPFLWYSKEAEEAAAFYASIFPDSRVIRVTALPSESPAKRASDAMMKMVKIDVAALQAAFAGTTRAREPAR